MSTRPTLLATAAAQPHDPGFVPVRPACSGRRDPGRDRLGRVRLLHRTGPRGTRGGGVARHHGTHDVLGPARHDRLPERPPELPRVRDVQAQPRPRPSGRRARRRLHRRRRERPLRRRLQRRRVGKTGARADLHRGRLAIPALDRIPRDRRVAGRRRWRLARRSASLGVPHPHPFFCGPEVWGDGRSRPTAGRVAAEDS